jgi:hypothetical protein
LLARKPLYDRNALLDIEIGWLLLGDSNIQAHKQQVLECLVLDRIRRIVVIAGIHRVEDNIEAIQSRYCVGLENSVAFILT